MAKLPLRAQRPALSERTVMLSPMRAGAAVCRPVGRLAAAAAAALGALLVLVSTGASASPADPGSSPQAGVARCLSRTVAQRPQTAASFALAEKGRTAWGLWLGGRAPGFAPGELLWARILEPGWKLPACLEEGRATAGGEAKVRAAFWYRASIAGRYTICVLGEHSGYLACGSAVVALPAERRPAPAPGPTLGRDPPPSEHRRGSY